MGLRMLSSRHRKIMELNIKGKTAQEIAVHSDIQMDVSRVKMILTSPMFQAEQANMQKKVNQNEDEVGFDGVDKEMARETIRQLVIAAETDATRLSASKEVLYGGRDKHGVIVAPTFVFTKEMVTQIDAGLAEAGLGDNIERLGEGYRELDDVEVEDTCEE